MKAYQIKNIMEKNSKFNFIFIAIISLCAIALCVLSGCDKNEPEPMRYEANSYVKVPHWNGIVLNTYLVEVRISSYDRAYCDYVVFDFQERGTGSVKDESEIKKVLNGVITEVYPSCGTRIESFKVIDYYLGYERE